MTNPTENPAYKAFIHRHKNFQIQKCLWHTGTCSNATIQAHTIQNSQVLDQIAENGHVIMFKPEMTGTEFRLDFKKIGRNLATTFTGLCSQHDTLLFRPIDTEPFDPTNSEHLFLVAYRSILKGLHASLSNMKMVQDAFDKGVELGQFSGDGPEWQQAAIPVLTAQQMDVFSGYFHDAYSTRNWSRCQQRFVMEPVSRVGPGPSAGVGSRRPALC